jgi:hypothetical protein
MVDVSIDWDRAVFQVEGFDKLWALRSRLEIPLAHITDVVIDPEAARGWWHGLRLLGTNMPGLLTAGTFYFHGEMVFWDVHDPAKTVIISLTHERYKKMIIEVADPAATVARLRAAVRS